MKTDKYGIEIKVGDTIRVVSFEAGEFPNYCSGSKGVVKEIKNKYIFCMLEARLILTKVCPENLYCIDENGKLIATSKQQLDFKVKKLKDRLSNTTDEYLKKILQSDIDWEWTKYQKREQKQKERANG